jgi:hypothetical protein
VTGFRLITQNTMRSIGDRTQQLSRDYSASPPQQPGVFNPAAARAATPSDHALGEGGFEPGGTLGMGQSNIEY